MKVSVVSFSYPRGVPEDADDDYWGGFVFDCRLMPDPHDEVSLRGYSGLDKPVIDFFERYKDRVGRFLDAAESLVRQTIEAAPETGRDYLQVAFGCYGGTTGRCISRGASLSVWRAPTASRSRSRIRRGNIGTLNNHDSLESCRSDGEMLNYFHG